MLVFNIVLLVPLEISSIF